MANLRLIRGFCNLAFDCVGFFFFLTFIIAGGLSGLSPTDNVLFLAIMGFGAFVTLRWVKESVLVVVNNG